MSVISDLRRSSSGKTKRDETAALNLSLDSGVKSPIKRILDQPLAAYYLILASTLLLIFIGALMVLSSSSAYAAVNDESSYYYLMRQCIFLAVGLPVAYLLSRCSENFLKIASWGGLILAIFMLVLVFTPLGVERFGNRAWLGFKVVDIQPSELAKAALILWSATVLSNRNKTLNQPMRLMVPLVIPGQLTVLGLVILQKDLGTAVIIAAIMVLMLFFVGAPLRVLAWLIFPALLAGGALIAFVGNRRARIIDFLTGASTNSDQPINAIYALASGGWWGNGLGASRQKWGGLYNGAMTDYVFAVLGEELGLAGVFLVIALFFVLGYSGLRVALRCKRVFPRLAAAGMTAWLMVQAIINMAVAMKMFPVMGVPLPFISYGGSALLANLIAIGILLACARCEPDAAAALQNRKRHKARVTTVVDAGSINTGPIR